MKGKGLKPPFKNFFCEKISANPKRQFHIEEQIACMNPCMVGDRNLK